VRADRVVVFDLPNFKESTKPISFSAHSYDPWRACSYQPSSSGWWNLVGF